jgi:hypothetical protein
LHLRRLSEARDRIPSLRAGTINAWSPVFSEWKARIQQSLGTIFGPKHDYARRWSNLHFCLPRITLGPETPGWTHHDQQAYNEDLGRAESVLSDALEESEFVPDATIKVQSPTNRPRPIVVNVLNILSQSTQVSVAQLLADLETIPLSSDQRAAAAENAKALASEVQGERRWPAMAKHLEALKALGKGVYEKVALPLLLEVIKRESGLTGS